MISLMVFPRFIVNDNGGNFFLQNSIIFCPSVILTLISFRVVWIQLNAVAHNSFNFFKHYSFILVIFAIIFSYNVWICFLVSSVSFVSSVFFHCLLVTFFLILQLRSFFFLYRNHFFNCFKRLFDAFYKFFVCFFYYWTWETYVR